MLLSNVMTPPQKFDKNKELAKMLKITTSIRSDIMEYVIKHVDRKTALFTIAMHVPFLIAEKIEKGILGFSMNRISNEKPDVVEFVNNIYCSKINDICVNLDMKNKKVNNQTLKLSLLNGSIDPCMIAFYSPSQLHPARWAKELEKQNVADAVGSNKKVTDIYKCRRCGDRKSTTTQKQTRSADEPMTIFVTCVTCHNTFTT